MKLHNVLMKSLALGAVVVSLSPLASVATLAHADGYVKSTLGAGDKVLTTKEVDYFGFHGGDRNAIKGFDNAGNKPTITITSNHIAAIKYEFSTVENGRDIFTGFNTDPLEYNSDANHAVVAKIHKAELNVPGKIVLDTGGVQAGIPEYVRINNNHTGMNVYEINVYDIDVTGKDSITTTFYAKDTGLSADYTATLHIKRAF